MAFMCTCFRSQELLTVIKFHILIFFLCLLSLKNSAQPAKNTNIIIAVNTIEELLEEGRENLAYSRILKHIKQNSSYNIIYLHNPANRAMKMLQTKEALCLFPSSLKLKQHQKNKIESISINTARAYFMAFKKISTQRVLNRDLPTLKIGYWRGNTYGENISLLSHHKLVDIDTDSQAAKMLEKKRIDVMLAYLPDSQNLINANPEKPWLYDKNSLFYTQNDHFVCHDTPVAQYLLSEINQTINKMKDSGELNAILKSTNQNQ